MSWNNIFPAELLSVSLKSVEITNPAISIPEELLTDCLVKYSWEGYGAVTTHADHPAFVEVRMRLNKQGYIQIPDYPCWNGDRVLKRFIFNDFQLEPGDTFYCAGAWSTKIAVRNKKLAKQAQKPFEP